MAPDEMALRRDLALPAFKAGERRRRWALRGLGFPQVLFFIAAPPRTPGPEGFLLLSDCSGYSAIAPTSQLWHGGADRALDLQHRPRNRQSGTLLCFTSACGPCLYHPIDRIARPHWPGQHADLVWTPDKDITFLLETVHAVLNTSDYAGADVPAAALELPARLVASNA